MKYYGCDKPDTRFDMRFVELNDLVKEKGFKVFDDAELVIGINAKGCSEYTRKQLDELTDFVKRPQIGATGLVYARVNADGTVRVGSEIERFRWTNLHRLTRSLRNHPIGLQYGCKLDLMP
jgi:aspartyl-tRNA synthetase